MAIFNSKLFVHQSVIAFVLRKLERSSACGFPWIGVPLITTCETDRCAGAFLSPFWLVHQRDAVLSTSKIGNQHSCSCIQELNCTESLSALEQSTAVASWPRPQRLCWATHLIHHFFEIFQCLCNLPNVFNNRRRTLVGLSLYYFPGHGLFLQKLPMVMLSTPVDLFEIANSKFYMFLLFKPLDLQGIGYFCSNKRP